MTYNLEEGQVPETNMPVRFYLKPNRGDGSASILVAEPLDYESTRFFILRVRAQNVAAVPLASFTTVYVNLTGETHDTRLPPFSFDLRLRSLGYTSTILSSPSLLPSHTSLPCGPLFSVVFVLVLTRVYLHYFPQSACWFVLSWF